MGRKVKVELPKEYSVAKIIDFGGKTVKIETIITLEKCDTILNDIKETILYNSSIVNKSVFLYPRYIRDVLDLCTNIDINDFEAEDFNSPVVSQLLSENILNFENIKEHIIREYEKWVMENCFGILANKIPSAGDMEKSVEAIANTIEKIPAEKLEMFGKSIAWSQSPALAQQIAPVEHKPVSSEA